MSEKALAEIKTLTLKDTKELLEEISKTTVKLSKMVVVKDDK